MRSAASDARWLTPVPVVDSLDELRALIVDALAADDARRIGHRTETIGEAFAVEAPHLRPLPADRFDTARLLTAKVDTKARICVLQAHYSVPVSLARRRVQVRLDAEHLEVLGPTGAIVAVHQRSAHKHVEHLQLDHYLELLGRKPGALAGSTPLAQARTAGVFTDAHQRFWDAARRTHGDAEGTRRLIAVLLLHRHSTAERIDAGIDATLQVGSTDPNLVAIETRRLVEPQLAKVIALHPAHQAATHHDRRPPPRLDGYDTLLPATTTAGARQ